MIGRAAALSGDASASRAWLNFAGLLVVAGVVQVLSTARGGMAAGDLPAALPSFYYGILPVVASISVGMVAFNASVTRQAVMLVAVTTVLMVVLDLLPWTLSGPEASQLALQGGTFGRSAVAPDMHGGGAIRTFAAFARGDLVLGTDHPARYAPDHPRLRATTAASLGGRLLLPAVLVGMILGVQAWVAERVSFRSSWDARLAHLLLSWVVSPATFFLVVGWVHRIQVQVLFGSTGLATMFLPYVPFALIAAIGWATAWRALRWTAG